jgi:serine/threonine-protein kinase
VAGAGAVLLLVVTVAAAVSKPAPADKAGPTLADSTARQKRDVDPPRPPAGTAPAKVGASKLATVEVLLDRGERERAFALLRELRSAEPADPDYAAMEARLSFEQRRWAEALAAYRMAIRLDDGRRNDGVLINGTIDSLQSEASTRAAEEALRMVGAPAEPYLENAAAEHPSPRVRGRARALLKAGARVATAGGRER